MWFKFKGMNERPSKLTFQFLLRSINKIQTNVIR